MRERMDGKRKQGGFTLIEVMVVVVILGILASVVVPRVMDRPEEARITQAHQDIRSLVSALDMYRLDNHHYPTTDQGLEALVEKPTAGPEPDSYPDGGYLDRLPEDPWGNPYQYLEPGEHGDIDVYSFGPAGDRHAGEDEIIGSWSIEG